MCEQIPKKGAGPHFLVPIFSMSGTKKFLVFRLPALLYMGLIFYQSSGPITDETLNRVPDYLLHAAGYALLYPLVFVAFHEGIRPIPGRGGLWLPLLVTIAYGASDEFHQSFVPGRVASLSDFLADAAGALSAAVLFRMLAPKATDRAVRPRDREGSA